MIVTPTAMSLAAIRDVIEQAAPKNITGERSDVISQFLQDGKIGWDINRGPLTVTGRTDSIAVSAPLNGTLRATGAVLRPGRRPLRSDRQFSQPELRQRPGRARQPTARSTSAAIFAATSR